MPRSPIILKLRKLKRTKWVGVRLVFGDYRIDLLQTGRWYLSKGGSPFAAASFRGTATAKRVALKRLRAKLREDYEESQDRIAFERLMAEREQFKD